MKKIAMPVIFIVFALLNTVKATDSYLTRQQFCQFIIENLEQRNNTTYTASDVSPFRDINDVNVNKAYKLGLVKGDETGNFRPDVIVTRQEAAVIFKRVQELIVPQIIFDNTKVKKIADRNEISDFAVAPVSFLSAVDVIPEGKFKPLAALNKETAGKVMDKIYQNKNKPVSKPGYVCKRQVLVLSYHIIGNPKDEKSQYAYLYVTPENFEAQIKYLSDNKYTFLFPDEINYSESCEKSVLITFDDGYDNNYTEAFRILKKYNAKATIFMIGSFINSPGFLSSSQLKQMQDSGLVKIGSHTMTHVDLSILNRNKLEYEMGESKKAIEEAIGKPVTNIAYPYGNYSKMSLQVAKKYYKSGLAVQQGTKGNPYTIRRKIISRDVAMDRFLKMITSY